MKRTMSSFLICGAMLMAPAAGFAVPLGTQFTYQGRLDEAGSPYTGTADMRFSLHNAEVAGAQVGVTIVFEGLVAPPPSPPNGPRVNVVTGLFQVELDFGVAVFNGEARWLQVQARVPAGVGGFVTLSPRQEVTAAPYALQTRGLFVEAALDVGIGTTNPGAKLHIVGGTDSEPGSGGYLVMGSITGVNVSMDENEIMARNNGAVSTLFLNNDGGDVAILAGGTGQVGIGTSAPATKLHVVGGTDAAPAGGGFIQLGPSNGANVGLDNNEIMARNNGVASTLFLNNNGGNIAMVTGGTGEVGIGTSTPEGDLHVFRASAGATTANANAPLVVENNTSAFINLLTPNVNESGVLFGNVSSNAAGGVIYNNGGTPNGLQFRTNGNTTRMVVDSTGDVGIGTTAPETNLHVFRASAGAAATAHPNAPFVVENSTNTYINILTPDANERGILFGENGSNVAGGIIYNNSTNPDGFQFRTFNNTTRMVLENTGDVGIGVLAPAVKLHVVGGTDSEPASGGFLVTGATSATNISMDDNEIMARNNGAASSLFLNNDGGNVLMIAGGTGGVAIGAATPGPFKLFVDGTAAKPGGGFWSASSDARLKKNVHRLKGALERVLQLRGTNFEYIDPDFKLGLPGQQMGLIAQEVEQVFPEWVSEDKDGYKYVTVRGLEALMVEALRDLRTETDTVIECQQAEIAAQKDENDSLRQTMDDLLARVQLLESSRSLSPAASPAALSSGN